MSDYYGAKISIPRVFITGNGELAEMIANECRGYNAAQILKSAANSNNEIVFEFESESARYGEFEDLEAYLVEHEIPFDRRSEATYGDPAVYCIYRPPTETESAIAVIYAVDCNERPYVTVDKLKAILEGDALKLAERLEALIKVAAPTYSKLDLFTTPPPTPIIDVEMDRFDGIL